MRRLRSATGLSLVEVAVMLGALAVITGALAPGGLDLVTQAKDLQASRDALSIRDALIRLSTDTGATRIATRGTDGPTVELLVSAGDTPAAAAGIGDARWTLPLDGTGLVDLLDRHLVTNEPGGNPLNGWPTPTRADGPGWRGAYLTHEIGADPWGRRYAVNVRFLRGRNEVIVLSAGPNGMVETGYEGQGLVGGGDDRVVLVK